jgi:hypothetical protein
MAIPLFIADGKVTGDGLLASAVAIPAWALGIGIGWPLRRHVEGDRFRRLVLGLLAAAGTTAIVFALV